MKETTEEALKVWLRPSTWDSHHGTDLERFYKFVSQYQRDHGFSLNEQDLRETIKRVAKQEGHPMGNIQEDVIDDLVSVAYKILDFLKATNR